MVEKEAWTIREMLVKLNKLYRGRFGIEYMHIVNEEEKLFLE
jgi:2-oxoglutarate dehydrogenase complex dehydrogenase (E1) component-like enzyme